MNNVIFENAKAVALELGLNIDDFKDTRVVNGGVLFTSSEPKMGDGISFNGFIVGEDNSFLPCTSSYPVEHYVERFENGDKHTIVTNTNSYKEILRKIEELPFDTESCIADLIGYKPEMGIVDPMTQGHIHRTVEKECKRRGYTLVRTSDSFGGLAYYYKFKKTK